MRLSEAPQCPQGHCRFHFRRHFAEARHPLLYPEPARLAQRHQGDGNLQVCLLGGDSKRIDAEKSSGEMRPRRFKD